MSRRGPHKNAPNVVPPDIVVTQNGDIICKSSISSFNAMATEPLVYVHLLRPMRSCDIAMLKEHGLMWNSLQTNEPDNCISDTVWRMVRAMEGRAPVL